MKKIVESGDYHEADKKGSVTTKEVAPAYIDHVLATAGEIKPLKLVIDAGNGITGAFLPMLLEKLPCDSTAMYFEPDGNFPNHEANPLKPENVVDLQAKVKEIGADLGIAMDGDGDRCAFVNEKGETVSSDIVTALIAREVLTHNPGD